MSSSGNRVLVVEDNGALASVVRFNLQREGYDVALARDGQTGLELARAGQFDLIITDQQMPVMSGCEMCALLRREERYAAVPIIMLTAKGLELDLRQLEEEYGVNASFSKPFSPREVLDTVAEHLPLAT